MQAFDFDYCDTYESYGSSGVMLENNGVRMFTCGECRGQKTFVKKSVNDSKFRCESCIQTWNQQNQNQVQAVQAQAMSYLPNSLILEMPTSTTTTAETTPQFSWRWLQFFT
uniref:Uncharacterized protein n=1 Tax=viral metagenome TaxID=1070528 RepID=A0A6C0EYQ9_9ZZZZ